LLRAWRSSSPASPRASGQAGQLPCRTRGRRASRPAVIRPARRAAYQPC